MRLNIIGTPVIKINAKPMKRSIRNLVEYSTETIHGEEGKIIELYFDDETMTVRYLLIQTGHWPLRRNALIPIEAIASFNWNHKSFSVNLTQEQILTSPDIDTTKPISSLQEDELLNHYPGKDYSATGIPGIHGTGSKKWNGSAFTRNYKGQTRLRSTQEVTGYHIYAIDGEVGVVDDFIVDDHTWRLQSVVVSIERWMQGKKVIIPPQSVSEINWEHSKVFVNLSEIAIKNCPAYETARIAVGAGYPSGG